MNIPVSYVAALLLLPAIVVAEKSGPPLWGYGVKDCPSFVEVWNKRSQESDAAAEVQAYQDWLAGFISGLNLATGEDVVRGVGVTDLMRRIHAECDGKPKTDFFNATLSVVKVLQGVGDNKPQPALPAD